MAEYQLILNYDGVTRTLDQATIPPDGGNRDWNEYLAWCDEGNVADPAPLPPEPPPPEPLELPADPVDDMHAATKGYVDAEVSAVTARLDAIERRMATILPASEA
jgi:hypothetical protein